MKNKKILLFILFIVSSFTLFACGSEKPTIEISADVYDLIAGDNTEIYVKVKNSKSEYSLMLSDNSLATIDENNVLTIKNDLTEDTTVAVIGSLKDDSSVINTKVFNIIAPKVEIKNETKEIYKGQTIDLGINVIGAKNKSITWSYSVQDVVSISKTNVLSVIKDVNYDTVVVLTATLNSNPNVSVNKTITVKKAPAIDLAAPINVKISSDGLITWNRVDGATAYLVKINGNPRLAKNNSYQVSSLYSDFEYSVAAVRNDEVGPYSKTETFKAKDPFENVTVGISGSSEVKSGKSINLTAVVNEDGSDAGVTWSIKTGNEYASITPEGRLTAKSVDGDKIIEVVATSVANPKKSATKIITITARPTLSQDMLDKLTADKIGFEGYINISLYKFGISTNLYQTATLTVKTAMDGTNWYSEYENSATGTMSGLYFKNHNDLACQVGVSFTNEEQFEPMLDDNDKQVSFVDSGLYNNFKGLKVSDFAFNEDTWRYDYVGQDSTLAAKMVASANPYSFIVNGFSLIIDDGEVLGIYAKSGDDYTISPGYRGMQELIVAVNYGDTVEVPSIQKYVHDPIHDELNTAIKNMQQLKSYTLDFKSLVASYMATGIAESGFVETITENDCYFVPYSVKYSSKGEEIHTPNTNDAYGYHKFNDKLYNAYSVNKDGEFYATRAYENDFKNAKPTFGFAGEIFTKYFIDEKEGTITYYVDKVMSPVASTFFYGVGNDINLYGIFATEGYISSTSSFTPYVTVKDGYIISACFYFYLGSMYGVVELKYSDFNTAQLPEDTKIEFTQRNVPTSWSELTIQVSSESTTTEDDTEVNALEYLKTFYNDENIGEKLPFFGNVLGDTYGFGLTTIHIPTGTGIAKQSVVFYYDVPLDVDYTIDSSLNKVGEYLLSLGFIKNANDEYSKDGIYVAPVDSSLDLVIYVWK